MQVPIFLPKIQNFSYLAPERIPADQESEERMPFSRTPGIA
jgi:hypothetical protein